MSICTSGNFSKNEPNLVHKEITDTLSHYCNITTLDEEASAKNRTQQSTHHIKDTFNDLLRTLFLFKDLAGLEN